MVDIYKEKVALLIEILPYISEESTLALHGGTAINLFVRDMPRLSVDIDLTYLPVLDRQTSLENINGILGRLMSKIKSNSPGSQVDHIKEGCKLIISRDEIVIKLEVNVVIRGTITDPTKMILCTKAQNEFEAFVTMNVVPFGQLFGGKICAALDRQHPRDMFDVKYLLEEEGFSDEVRTGFIFSLASSARPMNELLRPNLKDQRITMENQFSGMSSEEFSYSEYEETREQLVDIIHEGLTAGDKAFLSSIKKLEPDWSVYDFERFPSIRWKIQNLERLKSKDHNKYKEMVKSLESTLNRH